MRNKELTDFTKMSFLPKILILFGLFAGFFAETIFLLGLLGGFYRSFILMVAAIFLIFFVFCLKKFKILLDWRIFGRILLKSIKKDWFLCVLLIIFLVFTLYNLILALTPEIGFDALWYHLTLPKIYLTTHEIRYIPGGLLYYSVMPRISEMIYALGLAITPLGAMPKIIHYIFGLLWFLGTYSLARLFLPRRGALIAAVAIYGTYLISWLSAAAYIDLMVAFWAVMVLWAVFTFVKNPHNRLFLYTAGLFAGLLLGSKTYGLLFFGLIFALLFWKAKWQNALKFGAISLIIASPFYLQAYLATGNPLYPLFSVADSTIESYLNGYQTLKSWYLYGWYQEIPGLFWELLVLRFTAFLGLIFVIFFASGWRKMVLPLILFLAFFILWTLIPIHESRYFLPILPLGGVLAVYTFENIAWRPFKALALILFLMGLVFNFLMARNRFSEVWTVVSGRISKETYLKPRIPPPMNYYDYGGSFAKVIGNRKVLTVNIHNLFYTDFSFTDWTFIESQYKNKTVKDIATGLNRDNIKFVLIGANDISWWLGASGNETAKYFSLVLSSGGFNLYQLKTD